MGTLKRQTMPMIVLLKSTRPVPWQETNVPGAACPVYTYWFPSFGGHVIEGSVMYEESRLLLNESLTAASACCGAPAGAEKAETVATVVAVRTSFTASASRIAPTKS